MTPLGSSRLPSWFSGRDGCSEAASVCFEIFWRIARHLVSTSSALVVIAVAEIIAAFETTAGGGDCFSRSRSFLIDIPTSRAAAALLAGEFGLVFRSWLAEDKDDDPIDAIVTVIGPLPHKSDAAVILLSLVVAEAETETAAA